MPYYSEEELSQLRAKADIVDVISHYVQVQKKGRAYRAVCPFHDDHDPSMNINPDMQIYKCFVCGAGGNVFGFVQNYEKVSFPEAVEKVADLVGFTLSERPRQSRQETDPHRDAMHRVLNDSIQYMMYELNGERGRDMKAYLHDRGIDDALISRFNIGYNPDGDVLYRFLHAKGYEDRDMVDVNVIRLLQDGFHDVFSNRITFPIHDAHGYPVGFSARTLDKNNPSKYINTTETELYVKGRLVYNAHRAAQTARREGKIYVTEGVTDVIAFARAGVDNAVATLGTSCTNEQLALIRHLSPHIVFCYDGDSAGQNATWRAAQMARSLGAEVSVIRNETGLDPDEIVRRDGKEGLLKLLEREVTWMEFYLQYEKGRTNLSSYMEKKEFIEKVQAQFSTLDDTDRRYFTDQLSEITGIHIEFTPQSTRMRERVMRPVRTSVVQGITQAEDQILIMMMKSPSAARIFEDELGYLIDPVHQRASVLILEKIHRNGKADVVSLLDETEDQEVNSLLTSLVSSPYFNLPYDEMMLRGALRKVQITWLKNQAEAYKKDLASAISEETRKVMMKQYTECVSQLRRYIDEENHK